MSHRNTLNLGSALLALLLLVACGGDATHGMRADVGGAGAGPTEYSGPLAVECFESSDCPFTLGYATCWDGRCSVPCYGPGRTEDYSEACAAWGGTCREWDSGQFWCGP